MDDGTPIVLRVCIDGLTGDAFFDFDGTGPEVYGNCNAPPAVTLSAIIYCLRCMVQGDVPLNQGCLVPVRVNIPEGCILNPSEQAAVVGGNVLTSQRVTDVILKGTILLYYTMLCYAMLSILCYPYYAMLCYSMLYYTYPALPF